MKIIREVGHAPKVASVARELETLDGPCVGCRECRGICHALIELMTLPGFVLGAGAAA